MNCMKGRADRMKTTTSNWTRFGGLFSSILLLGSLALTGCQNQADIVTDKNSAISDMAADNTLRYETIYVDTLATAGVSAEANVASSAIVTDLAANMVTTEAARTQNKGKDKTAVSKFTADATYTKMGNLDGVDLNGLFHTQAPLFMNSEREDGEKCVIHLRTAKDNVVQASIWVRNYQSSAESISVMEKVDPLDKTGRYDYWKVTLPASVEVREYMFQVRSENGEWIYYGSQGASEKRSTKTGFWFVLASNGSIVPEWTKNAIFYSTMVESFFNGNTENDPNATRVPDVELWGSQRHTGSSWAGGDMDGMREKISYLKDVLGVTAVYTNPTFPTNHNAGYGQEDYTTINPYLGTNAEYAELIQALHDNDMHIINDGVWLYITWSQNRYTNENGMYPGYEGAFQTEDSPYHDFVDWLEEEPWPTAWRALYYNYPSINFDSQFTLDLMIRRPDSTLQYFLNEPYNMDGWRLDIPSFGGDVHTEDQIVALMRMYMRNISNDKLLVGEYGSDYNLADGAYDSLWYYANLPSIIRYYMGVRDTTDLWSVQDSDMPENQSDMLRILTEQLNHLTWQNAIASQMQLSTHDTSSIGRALGGDQSKIERAIALQMTVAGSPSIYVGDEIGDIEELGGYYRMDAFNWDTSEWNMKTFNTYRSLIAMRKAYDDTFSNGGFYALAADDDAKVMAYGRYTEKEGVITLINNDSAAHNMEIPVHGMGVVDGTYIYDWENGYKYEVKDGHIVATVAAGEYAMLVYGGTVVESEYTSTGMDSYDIGTADYLGRTYGDADAMTLTGYGQIGGKKDSFRFVGTELDGNATITVKVEDVSKIADNAAAGLMIRDDRTDASAYMMVGVSKSGVYTSSRASTGAEARKTAAKSVGDVVWLKLVRNGNAFTAYYAADNNGKAGNWTEIVTQNIQMTQHVRAGAVVTGGVTVDFTDFVSVKDADVYGDDFDKSVLNGIWTYLPENGSWALNNGDLKLTANNQVTRIVSRATEFDWSSRAEIKGATLSNGDEVGLVAWTTEGQQARIKRVRENGEYSIVFETESGGTTLERARIKDAKPTASVYVQLQKVGGALSALVSTDNKTWVYLGDAVGYNVAESYNGLYVASASKLTAAFGSFQYGAALSGKSGLVHVPTVPSGIDSLFVLSTAGRETLEYGYGDWTYTDAGYIQQSVTEMTEMYINRSFSGSYRLEARVEMRGEGGAGMAFGVVSGTSAHESGYQVLINKGNKVTLSYMGQELLSATPVGLDYQDENHMILYVEEERVRVYINERLALDYKGTIQSEGIAACITNNAAATFRNLYQLDSDQATVRNTQRNGFSATIGGIKSGAGGAYESTLSYAVSDFTMKTKLTIESFKDGASYTGIALYGETADKMLETGYDVLFKSGKVELWKDGRYVKSADYEKVAPGALLELTVTVKDGTLTVSDGDQQLLTSEITDYSGGRLSFLSNTAATTWTEFSISQ